MASRLEQAQTVIESSARAIILINDRVEIILYNEVAEKIFGYSRDEVKGASIDLLFPDEDQNNPARLIQPYSEGVARSKGVVGRTEGRRKDGSFFPAEISLHSFEEDNHLYLVCSVSDLSVLLGVQNRFHLALEALPAALLICNTKRTIVFANLQAERLFGFSNQELVGQPVDILIPEGVKTQHGELMNRYLENPVIKAMGKNRDVAALRKDGREFPAEVGLSPFRENGETFIIGLIIDLTERMEIKRMLVSKNEELQQYAYRTSHDLRSPLNSIEGLLEFIEEDIRSGAIEEALANIRKIRLTVQSLDQTLEDITTLAESNYSNEELDTIDIQDLVENVFLKFHTQAEKNGVELQMEMPAGLTSYSQRLRLFQILSNLVSNGIKYCDSKKENRFVLVRAEKARGRFKFTVEDNGMGIPQQYHAQVFGIFKKFHIVKVPSSGLGLYLVKTHVERMGGKISFTSSAEGSKFLVNLPEHAPSRRKV